MQNSSRKLIFTTANTETPDVIRKNLGLFNAKHIIPSEFTFPSSAYIQSQAEGSPVKYINLEMLKIDKKKKKVN